MAARVENKAKVEEIHNNLEKYESDQEQMGHDLKELANSFKQLLSEMEASWDAFVDESLTDFEATVEAEQTSANAFI